MATETLIQRPLPQGIGRFTRGWKIFFAVAIIVAGVGGYAYFREYTEGMSATGMRNVGSMGGATWGLYISMVVYLIGVSFAGITIAALIRLFKIEKLAPVARMAEVLTIVSLVLGGLAIIVDLGQPIRGIINLFRYARPQSPFFGTFTLVIAGYLFASLVYMYLGGRRDAATLSKVPSRFQGFHRRWAAGYQDTEPERRRHWTASFWLALAIVPLLIIAHSTLGFVFGLQVGRPGWYGTLQAPAFVALAAVSGVGHLIILAAIARKTLGIRERLRTEIFAWLGRFLLVSLLVYLYFMTVELLTLLYNTPEAEKALSDALLTGEYAWIYWGSVAALVIPVAIIAYQALNRRWNIGWLVASGVLVNVAAIGKRYLIVVPSQTHGGLLPYDVGSYTPSWIEWTVVAGILALGALLIGLFMKSFPFVPLDDDEREVLADA